MLSSERTTPLSDVDGRVFDAVVPKDHYLRRVRSLVDFERFRPVLEATYSPGLGRPAIDPVRMLKILFLRFHYRLSDRQVMERTRTDMAFRWFLDLGLHDAVPNHTSDTYFRRRVGPERFAQVFQDLVALAREHGLVKDRLRLKDATHLLADVAEVRALALAAQVRDQLLRAAEPFFAEWVGEQRGRLAALQQATAEWSDDERLASRLEFLRAAAAELSRRASAVPASAERDRHRLDRALAVAAKLLADRADPKASDRLASGVDPDARTGKHGDYFVGYLLDVAMDADSEIITAVNVLPGNGPEAADAMALIRQEEAAQGNDVAGLSMDGAGYNGPVLRELTDPTGLNLEVTVPPPPARARSTFGPERFGLTVLEAGVTELTCPAGQATRRHYRTDKDTGERYVFAAATCRACPWRGQCLEKPGRKGGRTVIKNDYDAEYQRVAAQARTPEYAATRREHPRIERKLGELVRYHGLRRARYRGLARVLSQALLTALVVNVKRLVRHLSTVAKPPPAALPVRAQVQVT